MINQTKNGLHVFDSREIQQFEIPAQANGIDLFEECKLAADRIEGVVRHTPLIESDALSNTAKVLVKDESSQDGNSFKTRNACNAAIHYLGLGETSYITGSAGSFGIGLADALKPGGHDLEVIVPTTINNTKADQLKQLGAAVVLHGQTVDESLDLALQRSKQTGARFVHPFANLYSIAGAGTIAWEILEDAPDMTHLVLPFGGGSIVSGVGTVIKHVKPEVEVVVAQVEKSTAFVDSVLSGEVKKSPDPDVRFGGIAIKNTHPLTLALGSKVVDRVLKLPTDYLYETLHLLKGKDELNTVLEEAGVCSPAGARYLAELESSRDAEIVCVATGANPSSAVNVYSRAIANRLAHAST